MQVSLSSQLIKKGRKEDALHSIYCKRCTIKAGEKKENVSPQVFKLYACHVLESSKVSTDSVLFFTPSTHPQILHKIETRPLTVVEHSYGKKWNIFN